MTKVNEVYAATLQKRLEMRGLRLDAAGAILQKANGWGGDDSLAMIEAIVDAAYLDGEMPGFDAVRQEVKELINPSAFRQNPLEKEGLVEKGEKGTRAAKPVNAGLAFLLKK